MSSLFSSLVHSTGLRPIYVIIFEFSRYKSLMDSIYVYEFYSSKVTKSFNFFSREYLNISTQDCTCMAMETKYIFILFSGLWVPITVIINTLWIANQRRMIGHRVHWNTLLCSNRFMLFPLKDTYTQTTTARATKGKVKPLQIIVLSCALVCT